MHSKSPKTLTPDKLVIVNAWLLKFIEVMYRDIGRVPELESGSPPTSEMFGIVSQLEAAGLLSI